MRAYSVGSRLEHSKRKFRMDHSLSSSLASNASSQSTSRTRAYSVGSRAKMPRSDQYKSSFVGSPAQIALFNSVQHSQYNTGSVMMMQSPPLNDANNNNSGSMKATVVVGKKSSSVPMLDSFGPSASGGAGVPNERVTDFMELDFSSISIAKISESDDYVLSDNLTPSSQPSLEHDYLNTKPMGKAMPSSGKSITEGYVEMRPVGLGSSAESVGRMNSPVRNPQKHHNLMSNSASGSNSNSNRGSISSNHMSKLNSSSLKLAAHEESNYLDMRGKDVTSSTSTQSPVIKSGNGSCKLTGNEDYLNMAPLNRDLVANTVPLPVDSGLLSTTATATASSSSSSSNVMTSSAEEGYLEMSFSRSNSITTPSTPSTAEFTAQQESYLKGRKLMTTNRSLPININYSSNSTVPAPGMTPITPRNNLGLFSKLSSLEEVHSPIQATAGGPGKKMSGSQVTTPTMFPFSPASPSTSATSAASVGVGKFQSRTATTSIGGAVGVGEMVTARKILVDGSTGTIKLSEDEQNSPRRKLSTVDAGDSSDYVDYEPPTRRDSNRSRNSVTSNGGSAADEEMQNDYVLMNPVTKLRRKSSGSKGLNNFRPIQSSADQQVMDGPQRAIALNRQLSLNAVSEAGAGASRSGEESPYELLRTTSGGSGSDLSAMLRSSGKKNVTSRPSSVNSDKITSRISNLSLNRPNSANSDRLSTISSSSSSTSTLCGGNSSSSSSTTTLCSAIKDSPAEMKPHSPMLTSRVLSDPSSSSTETGVDVCGGTTSLPNMMAATSMEKELHYASLDLPACSMSTSSSSVVSLTAPLAKPEADFGNSVVGKQGRSSNDNSTSSSASTTPSPNVTATVDGTQPSGAPVFNYAQLDFAKCATMQQQQ